MSFGSVLIPKAHEVQSLDDRTMRWLLMSVLAVASLDAGACECSYPFLENRTVIEARHIFIFQLLGAKAEAGEGDNPPVNRVIAQIRIVKQLRGRSEYASMEYDTFWCCGTRLDIGHFYVAFLTDTDGPFVGNPGNLIEVSESAAEDVSGKLYDVVSGKRTLESEYGEFPSERLFQVPRPPEPCPRPAAR